MSRSTSFRPRRVAAAVAGLLVPFLSGLAVAGPAAAAPATPATRPAQVPGSALTEKQTAAEAAATGRPVVVPADTTASSTTVVNPDGTFTVAETSQPVRVLRNGVWVALDATLHFNPDDTLSPAAATGSLVLSGGGSGPLAVMTFHGQRLALTWPVPLPAPTVVGNVATYPEVYPSVDLIVTADDQGGFSDVLEVKTAAAAANPALARIVIGTQTSTGLTVQADAAGDLSANSAAGTPYFVSPAPQMWDSATLSGQTPPVAVSPAGPAPADPANGMPTASTADAPGEGAHVVALGASASASSIVLTPARSLLVASSTRYPVWYDPAWKTTTVNDNGWAMAQYASSDPLRQQTKYWKPSVLQVGYDGWDGTPYPFVSRAYFQFPIQSPITNAKINTASVTFDEIYSPICTAPSGTDGKVQIWSTGSINSNTTWNTKPANQTLLKVDSGMYGYTSSCPGTTIEATATTQVTAAVNGSASTITFGLQADDETDKYGWKKFDDVATLTVSYDQVPLPVTNESSAPGVGGCQTGTPSLDVIGNNDLTLSAVASDPDANDLLTVEFQVFDYNTSTIVADVTTPTVANHSTATWKFTAATVQSWNPNGSSTAYNYSWWARASDSSFWSPFPSKKCNIDYDPTAPVAPAVTVANIDGTPIPATTGTATITPQAGMATPVSYTYQIDDSTPSTVAVGASGCTSTSCTVTLPNVSRVGPHTVYVWSTSAAGNISLDPGNATFATTKPSTSFAPGDLTGDGNTDLVTAGGAGAGQPAGLWLYQGTGTATLGNTGVNIGARGDGISSPTSAADFTGAMITTGDFTGNGIGDILVYLPDGIVQFMRGTGNGGVLDPTQAFNLEGWRGAGGPQLCAPSTDLVFDTCTTVLTGTGAPITLTSLVADGDLNADGVGPDLVATTSDGHLWYFPADTIGDGTVKYQPAVAVSGPDIDGTDWTNWTIATAASGGNPALYARNTTTGELDLYTTTDPANDPVGSTLSTKQVIAASGFTSTAAPMLTGTDINKDDVPDLWVTGVGTTATAKIWDGTSLSSTNTTTSQPADGWPLTDGQGVTAATDYTGSHPATLSSTGAGWTSGTDDPHGTALQLDGVSGHATTTGPVINTNQSFTISAWVDPATISHSATGGFMTAVSQDGTVTSGVQLQYRYNIAGTNGQWCMSRRDANTTTSTLYTACGGSTPVPNSWVQLTGVYDSSSGKNTLYIDGVFAGSVTVTINWNATGLLAIGSRLNGTGNNVDWWQGNISQVQTYQSALTAAQVVTLYDHNTITGPGTPISYVAATSVTGTSTSQTVTVPASVVSGDVMVMYYSANTTSPLTAPSGWTLIANTPAGFTSQTSWVWYRVATAADAGTTVTVGNGSTSTKASLVLADYRGVKTSNPIGAVNQFTTTASVSSVTTPTVTITNSGTWILSYWNAKSSVITGWTPPTGQVTRATAYGSGGGYMDSILTDAGSVTPPGTAGGYTATTDQPGGSDVAWTIALNQGP